MSLNQLGLNILFSVLLMYTLTACSDSSNDTRQFEPASPSASKMFSVGVESVVIKRLSTNEEVGVDTSAAKSEGLIYESNL
ncbi:hypothetical protein [Microbulbifer epialgicus]|uniref:Uncharacterized protein n=1 Tax=Microbulbifer epialgicus TaxID=393907 RepID=A0ABV4P1S2_9GAMM